MNSYVLFPVKYYVLLTFPNWYLHLQHIRIFQELPLSSLNNTANPKKPFQTKNDPPNPFQTVMVGFKTLLTL